MTNLLTTSSHSSNVPPVAKLRRQSALLTLSLALVVACGGPSKGPGTATAGSDSTAVVADSAPAPSKDSPSVALPAIPSSPAEAPASLMAEVILSNPNEQLTQVGIFMDAVSPGVGAFLTPAALLQLLAGITGAVSLDGVDLNAPLFVMALDTQEVVIVVTMSSEADLRSSVEGGRLHVLPHNGFAAVGSANALSKLAPYALSNLAVQPALPLPTLNLHIGKIMAGAQGDVLRGQIGVQLTRARAAPAVVATVTEIFNNIDVLSASLEANQQGATVHALAKIEGGRISEFLGKQQPSSFAMMDRIGTGPWGLAVAGRLDLSVFAPLLVALGEAEADLLLTQIAAQVSSLNGEMALGLNFPKKPEVAMTMELQDAKGMAQVVNTLMSLASKKKDHDLAGMTARIKMASIKTRAGSLHEMRAKPTSKEHIAMYGKKNVSGFFGVVVTNLIATFGNNAKKNAKTLASANGKIAGKGSKLSAAIAVAKQARESLLIAMDSLSIQGDRPPKDTDPFIIGVGFDKSAIRARLVFPTEFVKEASSLNLF